MISWARMKSTRSIPMALYGTARGKKLINNFGKLSLNVLFHRITLRLGCSMDLAHFPLDSQVCSLKVSSCELAVYTLWNTCIDVSDVRRLVWHPASCVALAPGRTCRDQ
jgi:hypothetical protein